MLLVAVAATVAVVAGKIHPSYRLWHEAEDGFGRASTDVEPFFGAWGRWRRWAAGVEREESGAEVQENSWQ